MAQFKIYITRRIPDAGLNLLKGRRFHIAINPHNRPLTRPELLRAVKDKDGLLCLLSDKIDAAVIDAGPRLKVISTFAVGYDNIDIAHATIKGIMVTNTPGVLTEATAELTWALILAIGRRIPEAERFVRAGRFNRSSWGPRLLLGVDIHHKTIGIVGAGRIGQSVARKALGFQMPIIYTNRSPEPEFEKTTGARRVTLHTLLKTADFVCLHVPGTPATDHLISRKELRLMKPTAYLINAARGPVVDEAALAEALKKKIIAGAALDVYEHEPRINPSLLKLDNVVLMPHLGSATVETRNKMALMAAQNLIDGLFGKQPTHLVNPG